MGNRAIAASPGWVECEDDEIALVRAARTDASAFNALYRRYRIRLYWYLRTRTATDEDAADLTQQTFLQVWDALPRYQERGLPFAAWLFRIARNLAANAARKRRDTIDWDTLPETLPSHTPDDLEARALHNETLAQLRALLRQLDPDKREMLILRFVAGLTVRELAVVLGTGEEAMKKRLGRTIHALKEQFDER